MSTGVDLRLAIVRSLIFHLNNTLGINTVRRIERTLQTTNETEASLVASICQCFHLQSQLIHEFLFRFVLCLHCEAVLTHRNRRDLQQGVARDIIIIKRENGLILMRHILLATSLDTQFRTCAVFHWIIFRDVTAYLTLVLELHRQTHVES